MTEGDGVRAALERELYWATEGEGGERASRTQSARVAADRLAQRLRRDAFHAAPWGDLAIVNSRGFMRRVKIVLHRIMRPISRRYDRIGADLAQVTVQLADSLLQLERDLHHLREDVAVIEHRLGGPASPQSPAARPAEER
jgi:hypothetical protein